METHRRMNPGSIAHTMHVTSLCMFQHYVCVLGGVFRGCFQRLSSAGVFNGCIQRVSSAGVFNGCLQRMSSTGVFNGCRQGVSSTGVFNMRLQWLSPKDSPVGMLAQVVLTQPIISRLFSFSGNNSSLAPHQ